ncbi:hypothetical protein D9M72_414170 [compost metagenome]
MRGPLQRPRHIDERAGLRQVDGQLAQQRRGYTSDACGPVRVLHAAVVASQQFVGPGLEAHAVAAQERLVMAAGAHQFASQRHHGRSVGVWADRNPLDAAFGRVEVVAHRAEVDHPAARRGKPCKRRAHAVLGGATRRDLRVLRRNATERHQQAGVGLHHVPAVVHGHQLFHRRDDVRHEHARRAQAVAVDAAHIATDHVEHPVHLALRVMEAPRTRPAVRAAEDGLVAMRIAHPPQLVGHQVERVFPFHFDKRLAPAQLGSRAGAFAQPAAAHGRPLHAQRRPVGIPHGEPYRRWVGVFGQGPQANGAALVSFDLIDAPVGGCQFALRCSHRDGALLTASCRRTAS